jgi:nitrite reductase (NADH) large subunit
MSKAMSKERLIVIGNGMAGCRAVEEVLKRDPDRYEIAIFGTEPRVNYNRIMLSPVLAGEKTFEDIVINDEAWYRDNASPCMRAELSSGSTWKAGRCWPKAAWPWPTTS